MIIGKLCCGSCQQVIKPNTSVIISTYNTIAHEECFDLLKVEIEKDSGNIECMVNRYLN